MVLGPLHLPLVLLLPLQEVAAWRHAGRGSSALQSSTTLIQSMWGASETTEMEVISSSGVEKVLCTQRLPYFRNRLCLQLKSHSAALEGAISAIRGSSGPRNGTSMHRDKAVLTRALKNPLLALPDLTIDLAWMGCSTCVPEMRVCSADQICRKDPKDSLSYPWIRIFPLSLESLVAGTCYGVADLLVSSTAAAAFAPLLGFLAPYLAGLMGTLTARVFDDLLMGRYCIYLSTHLAQEVLGDQILAQDSTCIDHLFTIHIPGVFGIVKSRKFTNPGTPIVCWPTAGEVQSGPLYTQVAAKSAATEDAEADELEPPTIASPAEVLHQDKVCREGASENLCTACQVAIQAATWRLLELHEKIRLAGGLAKLADQLGDDEDADLQLVENRMLIHANRNHQCTGDRDPACYSDYSLCVLKAGMEEAKQCDVSTVHMPEATPFCWWLCSQGACPTWGLAEPSCSVAEEHASGSCLVHLRGAEHPVREPIRSSRFSNNHWVHCNPGRRAPYPKLWQHRMVSLYSKYRKTPGTTEEIRAAAERQVLQRLAEPAPSAPSMTLLDISLLRILQLAANHSFHELRGLFCQEAACCTSEHTGMS